MSKLKKAWLGRCQPSLLFVWQRQRSFDLFLHDAVNVDLPAAVVWVPTATNSHFFYMSAPLDPLQTPLDPLQLPCWAPELSPAHRLVFWLTGVSCPSPSGQELSWFLSFGIMCTAVRSPWRNNYKEKVKVLVYSLVLAVTAIHTTLQASHYLPVRELHWTFNEFPSAAHFAHL